MASVAESPNRLFWLIVLALFLPFMSVGIEFGFCSQEFWVNLILSLLIPFCGFIHAVYVLVHARYSRAPSRSGYEPVPDTTDAERRGAQPAASAAAAPPAPGQAAALPAKSAHTEAPALLSPATSPRTTPAASSSKAAAAPESAAAAHHHVQQPPPYTPGNAVAFDNKIQRS